MSNDETHRFGMRKVIEHQNQVLQKLAERLDNAEDELHEARELIRSLSLAKKSIEYADSAAVIVGQNEKGGESEAAASSPSPAAFASPPPPSTGSRLVRPSSNKVYPERQPQAIEAKHSKDLPPVPAKEKESSKRRHSLDPVSESFKFTEALPRSQTERRLSLVRLRCRKRPVLAQLTVSLIDDEIFTVCFKAPPTIDLAEEEHLTEEEFREVANESKTILRDTAQDTISEFTEIDYKKEDQYHICGVELPVYDPEATFR